jgi:hypothetical protein
MEELKTKKRKNNNEEDNKLLKKKKYNNISKYKNELLILYGYI